jgi:uncharacterized protein (TIGR02466 family)
MAERLRPLLESTDVHGLFPSLVWEFQLREETRGPIDAALGRVLARLRAPLPPLASGAAWQSGFGLHRQAELRELVAVVELASRSVLEFLRTGSGETVITGCWATVLAPGAAHAVHQHPNNYLGAVYYLQVPRGADTVNFHDPRPQAGVIRPPVTELTRENTDQVVFRVRPGRLLLFPAWLPHSVPANAGESERISVSFNLMFAHYAEELGRPLWGEE